MRDVLIQNMSDFFSQNRDNFIDFSLRLIKNRDIANDKIEGLISRVYDLILTKEPDYISLNSALDEVFDIELKNYTLSRTFLHLIKLHVEQKQADTLELIKVIEEILENLCNEKIDEEIQSSIDEDSSTKPTGFAASLLEADGEFSLHENIIDTFEKIKANVVELEFLNLYKDVPVKSSGRVVNTEENYVTFQISLMQMLAIIEEKSAFIVKNEQTKKHIKADIIEYDIAQRTIKLGNFSRFNCMPASQRVYTRVHPIDATKVMLSKNSKNISGLLFDISQGGMAVLSKDDLDCKHGDNLVATFELTMPNSTRKMQIEQNLELVVQIDYQGAHRYCMKSIPNETTQGFITNFTRQREIDTIEDLKTKIDTYSK